MKVELITSEDLQAFKAELLDELKNLVTRPTDSQTGKWLKSAQVRQLLKISPGTLQTLRISGQLQYTKVGGSFYYRAQDIEAMLNGTTAKKK
jgi:hypothetical protein